MKKCIDKAAIGNILHKLWKKDTGFENIDIARIAYNGALQDVQCEIDTLEVQEEPVSEDFGEYINELSKQFPEVSFAKVCKIATRTAKWQKQQMMAKAIEGRVLTNFMDEPVLYLWDRGRHLVGKKVKVIVIKEE